MTTVSRTMIIREQDYALADALASAAAGAPGSGMWGEGQRTSASGSLPAEKRITSGPIDSAFADLLPLTHRSADGVETTAPGQPEAIVALAASKGLVVSLALVQDLLANVDVTDVDEVSPQERLRLLGQKIIVVPLV